VAVHYEVVDGLRLPAKLSGHPALDFCNTLTGWDGHDQRDYLRSYEHLAVLAGFAELLPARRIAALRDRAGRQPKAADEVLEAARGFRARLYEVLSRGPSASALDLLADDVHAALSRLRLRPCDAVIRWEIDSGAGLSAPLDAVAWSAAQLLTSSDFTLVRACPGHGCGWLFLDRRGRRRWCTMATCGNRAKVKSFATRRRGTDERGHGRPAADV
jgi:predicted RNA-binding Zn ribbon-like protein